MRWEPPIAFRSSREVSGRGRFAASVAALRACVGARAPAIVGEAGRSRGHRALGPRAVRRHGPKSGASPVGSESGAQARTEVGGIARWVRERCAYAGRGPRHRPLGPRAVRMGEPKSRASRGGSESRPPARTEVEGIVRWLGERSACADRSRGHRAVARRAVPLRGPKSEASPVGCESGAARAEVGGIARWVPERFASAGRRPRYRALGPRAVRRHEPKSWAPRVGSESRPPARTELEGVVTARRLRSAVAITASTSTSAEQDSGWERGPNCRHPVGVTTGYSRLNSERHRGVIQLRTVA